MGLWGEVGFGEFFVLSLTFQSFCSVRKKHASPPTHRSPSLPKGEGRGSVSPKEKRRVHLRGLVPHKKKRGGWAGTEGGGAYLPAGQIATLGGHFPPTKRACGMAKTWRYRGISMTCRAGLGGSSGWRAWSRWRVADSMALSSWSSMSQVPMRSSNEVGALTWASMKRA